MDLTNHHSEFGEEQTARGDGSQTSLMLFKKLIQRDGIIVSTKVKGLSHLAHL